MSAGEDPRRTLARHGLGAKKSWGQNFLRDRAVLARIAAATQARPMTSSSRSAPGWAR